MNNGRHANSWVSWAQMEEAEGNIESARTICMAAIAKYEHGLLIHNSTKIQDSQTSANSGHLESPIANKIRKCLTRQVPIHRSGDRFFNVYRNWARLEERHGTTESAEEVYRRAMVAFPNDWKLPVDCAQFHGRGSMHERAREFFVIACSRASGRHGDPYRLHAEFEMSLGNYEEAQKIMFQGSVALSQNAGNSGGNGSGMAQLYYVWAVCEWHLHNLHRAEIILDQALRLTISGNEGSTTRSLIFYAMATLHRNQRKPVLAQHFIGLCLKENSLPAEKTPDLWNLWADVASQMNNDRLSSQCRMLAEQSKKSLCNGLQLEEGTSRRKQLQHRTRRDPWHIALFGSGDHALSTSYQTVWLPNKVNQHA